METNDFIVIKTIRLRKHFIPSLFSYSIQNLVNKMVEFIEKDFIPENNQVAFGNSYVSSHQ